MSDKLNLTAEDIVSIIKDTFKENHVSISPIMVDELRQKFYKLLEE